MSASLASRGLSLVALMLLIGCRHPNDGITPDLACVESQYAIAKVVLGEIAYFNAHARYFSAPEYSTLNDSLHTALNHVNDRWTLRVQLTGDSGYVATIDGKPGTPSEGINGRVSYVIGKGYHYIWTGSDCAYDADYTAHSVKASPR